MNNRHLWRCLVVAIALSAGASLAQAQEMGFIGWGFRAGLSVNPDQVFGGFHVDLGEPVKHLRLIPNIEYGVGDDTKLFAVNLGAHWEFTTTSWGGWMPYAGAEAGFQYTKFDNLPRTPRRPFDDDDTDVQLSAVGGLERTVKGGNKWFIEAKIGLLEDPDLKGMVGITF